MLLRSEDLRGKMRADGGVSGGWQEDVAIHLMYPPIIPSHAFLLIASSAHKKKMYTSRSDLRCDAKRRKSHHRATAA